MKKLLGTALLLVATGAFGQNAQNLASVDGVIVTSVGEYQPFSIATGNVRNCEVDNYFTRCDLVDSSVTISTSAGEETVQLTRYLYSQDAIGDTEWEEWIYIGTWEREVNDIMLTSDIRFVVFDRSDVTGYFGYMRLDEFDKTHQFKARVAR